MNITRMIVFIALLISMKTYSDVYITVEAQLIRPACIVNSESNKKDLTVNFQNVDPENLAASKQPFSILITQCDLRKNLQVYLVPKEGRAITMNNETVLSTSTEGLGIRLSENNKSTALGFHQWENINPMIDGNRGKVTFQAQLVTNVPIDDLVVGPFSSSLSLMIDYL